MAQDVTWKIYFSDDERYADIINGIGCSGKQLIAKDDLQELDTQTGFWHIPQFLWIIRRGKVERKIKFRDMLRKAAFGVNFAIIGIENQESIDYSIPLRNMLYDIGEYEKHAVAVRRKVRRNPKGLTRGDGNEYFKNMEEDAFDVAAHYTNAAELIDSKNYYEGEDGRIDMCTAIKELITDGRNEGRTEGITIGRNRGIDEKTRIILHNMLNRNMPIKDICAIAECSEELVREVSRDSLN